MRKSGHKLRLRSALQAKTKRPARFQDLLNDLMKLIDLDRVDANVRIPVAGFFDRLPECGIEFCNAGAQKILEPDEQRKLDSLLPQILNDLVEVDTDGVSQVRAYCEMALLIDVEIGFTPERDSIEIFGILNRPEFFFCYFLRHSREIRRLRQKSR